MNKKVYALAVIASFLGFTSCGEDDEDVASLLKKTEKTTPVSSELNLEEVAIGNWKVKSVNAMGQEIAQECVGKGRAKLTNDGKLSMQLHAITPMTGPHCTVIATVKDQKVSLFDRKIKVNVMGMDMEFAVSVIDKEHLRLQKSGIPAMEVVLKKTNENVVIEEKKATAPVVDEGKIKQALVGNWVVEGIDLGGNYETACAGQGTFDVTQEGNSSMKIFYNLGQCAPIIEKNNEPLKFTEKGEIVVTTTLLPQPINLTIKLVDETHITLTNDMLKLIIKLKRK